ncbi:protein kinase [Gemmata sp. G18]|uniref:Protein kinase n=1 Tax=Gemmata palustris TaxID=2822762 RepID=A0ABS5BLE8_9BACT|nr:serine/threonine-protein kinase [Gemmata palustris]MBP3954140.1 protein kinase [Gemmata palustris]
MDSSDSLKIDEHLARFLAAYDQGLEGGDTDALTVNVPFPPPSSSSVTTERPVTPMHPDAPNEGSLGELLPDPGYRPGRSSFTPPPSLTGSAHRIGRFELRRQLGKGGCGIVFLAYDPKLRREIALKIPRPEMLLNADAKRRLKLEALAASEFDHPNLVPVYEWGEIGPLCFIATAFCPGLTLAEWIDRQAFPVPVRQAARLVATVADAVQHAHDRGVLHRDLKPNNVILQEMKVEENDEAPAGSVQMRGEYYVPRVVDFGLAKLAERGGPSETGTRQILGTPKYMAPEQAQARREDIGPPADVYALGVVLYELVAGRAPYDGASDVEVLRQSVEGRATHPRHLRPDLPRDLEAICLKAMARDTGDRYRTAIDLADDLRRFLDGRPTVARPLAWSGRAVRWLRRNDQIVAIAVLAVIALSVTLLGTWNSWQTRNLRDDRNKALSDQADRHRADQQREYARHVRDAYYAWRGGNTGGAVDALDSARRAASTLVESTDFTHDYLSRLVKSDRLLIECPAGAVTALAAAPDGTRLATGHADGTLAVWDRATGNPLGTLKAHAGDVTHVAFGLGGTVIVTVGRFDDSSSTLTTWSAAPTGALSRAPDGRRFAIDDVSCCAVAPDGKTVFVGGPGGSLMKVQLATPHVRLVIPGAANGSAIAAIAVAPDGTKVLTADAEGIVCRRATDLKREELPVPVSRADVSALAATARGVPVIGTEGGSVFVAGASQSTPAGGSVSWIATSGTTIATNGKPGRIRLGAADLATGDSGAVLAGAFSPDGKTLFTGSDDGTVRSWDVDRDPRARGAWTEGRVVSISVASADGTFVVATDRAVKRYGTGAVAKISGAVRVVRVLEGGGTRTVAFDGKSVVVSDLVGSNTRELLRAGSPARRALTDAALTPDGARVAAGDDSGRVTVWSVTDRTVLDSIDTGLRRPVQDLALSDDGRFVAARTATGVGVWAVGTPTLFATLYVDDRAVFQFLPGSDRIAAAGRDGGIVVWSVGGREEMRLFGHVGRVTGLGVSPDGRTLVSGCATGEVVFWDLKTGQDLFAFQRHSTPVTVIEFATDGKFMVTGGDGQIAVWDARD